jgi:hypothetical protein
MINNSNVKRRCKPVKWGGLVCGGFEWENSGMGLE